MTIEEKNFIHSFNFFSASLAADNTDDDMMAKVKIFLFGKQILMMMMPLGGDRPCDSLACKWL